MDRLDADGPACKGLAGEGRTKLHRYYAGLGKSSVGVWETAPHTGADFHTTKYAELMVFLSGSGRSLTPDGGGESFTAGDVVLVPRGASCTSGRATASASSGSFFHNPGGRVRLAERPGHPAVHHQFAATVATIRELQHFLHRAVAHGDRRLGQRRRPPRRSWRC